MIASSIPYVIKYTALFIFGLLCIEFSPHFFPVEDLSGDIFGRNFLSSLGALCAAGSVIGLVMHLLSRQGVDRISLLLFALASLVSLHYLHISDNYAYTNDWRQHLALARHIRFHWNEPFSTVFINGQFHHPLLYYYTAALFIKLSSYFDAIPTLTAVRFLSWIAYLAFNAYGLLTIRLLPWRKNVYYTMLALFLCWPAGFHLAGKISNEPLYFALYAVGFYYAIRGYLRKNSEDYRTACLAAAVALLARSNAILLFAIIGVLMLFTWLKDKQPLRQYFTFAWLRAAIIIISAVIINLGTFWMMDFSTDSLSRHFGWGKDIPLPAGHFFTLHWQEWLERPFNTFSPNQSFWDILFKTSLFGEYKWPWPAAAACLIISLLLLVIYTLLATAAIRRRHLRNMFPFILGLALPLAALIGYGAWKQALPNQDARIIYPAMLCFTVWFGLSTEMLKDRGHRILPAAALLVAWGFVGLSVVYFWTQSR